MSPSSDLPRFLRARDPYLVGYTLDRPHEYFQPTSNFKTFCSTTFRPCHFPFASICLSLMSLLHFCPPFAQLTGGKGWCPGLVHHKSITRTWTKYQAKTHLVHLKSIQNFPNQFSCSVPGSGNGQYIHSVPDHVTRVSPSGTPWEHSKFSQRKYPEFS